MAWPESTDYIEAVQNLRHSMSDEELRTGLLAVNHLGLLPDLTNSIGMQFQLIPAGEFTMGSPESEVGRGDDEVLHRVCLTKDFYIGTYEVTQKQYEAVMVVNPSHFKGPNLPVESVTWQDAGEFWKKLSEREGRAYRLPTEAEWFPGGPSLGGLSGFGWLGWSIGGCIDSGGRDGCW